MRNALNQTRREDGSTLDARIVGNELTVGVIGQGVVGTMTARLAARAVHRVIGFDRDPVRAAEVRRSIDTPHWSVVDDSARLDATDVVVIAVRAPVNGAGRVDLQPLRDAFAAVAGLVPRERLVIVETTVPPGTTRQLAGELLSTGAAHVVHCPERLRGGDSPEQVLEIPRIVGPLTPASATLACRFLQRIGYSTVPVSSPEISELAKLLENVFLTTGISLMSEITRIAHSLGISATEVASAAATKPGGYYPFWPGAGIGGHCLPNDLAILRNSATDCGVPIPVLDGVGAAVPAINEIVADFVLRELHHLDIRPDQARILIVGVGFKVGSSDTTATPAVALVRLFRALRASVCFCDRDVETLEVDTVHVPRLLSISPIDRFSASVILAGDRTVSLDALDRVSRIILDLGGARIMSGTAEVKRL